MRSGAGIARQFSDRAQHYENAAHRWQAQRAVAHADLRLGQRVLDIATGTGLAARAAAAVTGPDGEVVGIHAAEGLVTQARAASGPGIRYIAGDGVDLPGGLGTFDRLLCVAALPYLGDPAIALNRWKAVCRPEARITITVPADRGLLPFALLQDAAQQEDLTLRTPDAGLGTAASLAAMAARMSFRVEARAEEAFTDGPLRGDAGTVLEHFLNLGHAPSLAAAPASQRQAIRRRFIAAYDQARDSPNVQRVVFARLALSQPARE